jgi:hypothetical protein
VRYGEIPPAPIVTGGMASRKRGQKKEKKLSKNVRRLKKVYFCGVLGTTGIPAANRHQKRRLSYYKQLNNSSYTETKKNEL